MEDGRCTRKVKKAVSRARGAAAGLQGVTSRFHTSLGQRPRSAAHDEQCTERAAQFGAPLWGFGFLRPGS